MESDHDLALTQILAQSTQVQKQSIPIVTIDGKFLASCSSMIHQQPSLSPARIPISPGSTTFRPRDGREGCRLSAAGRPLTGCRISITA